MKHLHVAWKPRLAVILSVSLLLGVFIMTLDQTSWAEHINLQGYSHDGEEGEGRAMPTVLRYILPFVKEFVLIGIPMILTILLTKLVRVFTSKK